MPQIKVLEPGDVGLRPSETGVEAVAGAARRGGAFYNQAAEAIQSVGKDASGAINAVGDVAVKYMEHREISTGAANYAQMQDNLTNAWNQTAKNADPNDPTIAAKFREEVLAPTLDKYAQSFSTEGGQKWAEQHVDALRNHMFAKTTADMSNLAGIAVRENAAKTVNALSSSVASDPSGLDFALKTVDSSLGAVIKSSPNLSPEVAASVHSDVTQKAKEQIVKSAISGMIQKNPNVDLDGLQKKYGEYINGAEMKMFQKAAQTQAKVDLLQQKQLETYARQQEEHQANTALAKVVTDNVTIDPTTNRPVINPKALSQTLDIARQFPQAGPAVARTMIDWIESQQNKEVKSIDDPGTVKVLNDRLFDPDKPTTKLDLMRAQSQGKISDHTFQQMSHTVDELQQTPLRGPVYQDTMKAVHGALVVNVPGIQGKDNVGDLNYAKFVQSFVPQYIAKSRDGTLPPNALDINDPKSMISQSMAPFKRTPQQRMQDYLSGLEGLGEAANARSVGGVRVPPALGGIAALQYNPTSKQWRDQASGVVYDSDGRQVR